MSNAESSSSDVSRREFIRFGSLGAIGMQVADPSAHSAVKNRSCITIYLNGGPSHFETFDPKPEAPLHTRGPYKGIATHVPGMQLSETLPLLAQRAEHFSLLRSLWHSAAPIHETGQQLLQTGRLSRRGVQNPSLGSMISHQLGGVTTRPAYVVLPDIVRDSGVYVSQGQMAGGLGDAHQPICIDPANSTAGTNFGFPRLAPTPSEIDRYGRSPLGNACLAAVRLVAQGVRFVGINMFPQLTGQRTWDCHGSASFAPATIRDYRETICPEFDRACAALLDDLCRENLLSSTLVVAAGEFGRTPRINPAGGRDHWTGVWSAMIAGGGTQGGRVIGASDKRGEYPADRPIALEELAATVLQATGCPPANPLRSSDGIERPLAENEPIHELWA